jgi:hypothetical protein
MRLNHLSVTALAISTFVVIPGILLTDSLWIYGLALFACSLIGYFISSKFKVPSLKVKYSRLLLYLAFACFLISEFAFGLKDFISLNQSAVDNYLNNGSFDESAKFLDLIQNFIRTFFLVTVLINSDANRIVASIMILFYGLFISGISRSSIAIFLMLSLFVLFQNRNLWKLILITIITISSFSYFSGLRGDNETSALGNPLVTAIGFPILNLESIIDSDMSGESKDFIMQLAIKPIPGFIFSIFGHPKPIINFNANLTERITGSLISANRPISVYTSAAVLVYYKPFISSFVICCLIYALVGAFFLYIKNHKLLTIYSLIALFFLHRSNLLDIISFVILHLIIIFIYKLLSSNNAIIKKQIT